LGFNLKLFNIHLETPFFLDRDLGEDLPKGEDIAKSLFEKGFQKPLSL
tara:strand:- start:205 stop:348 length:144 start_codon:yes stop_codon:yes gene_type:complete